MVAVSPDTRTKTSHLESMHAAGYWYEDNLFAGFSHLHLAGAGVPDLGTLLLFPSPWMTTELMDPQARVAGFSHQREQASPGYYAVTLDNGIHAEVTAGERAAAHRYSYPEGTQPTLIIDLAHALSSAGDAQPAQISIDPEAGVIRGSLHSSGDLSSRFGGFRTWFRIELSHPPSSWGTWADGEAHDGTDAEGMDAGAWLSFAELAPGQPLELRVGLSFTSVRAAGQNLEAEWGAGDFDSLRDATASRWREALGRVRVWGGSERDRTIFHTALYRCLLMPHLLSDADGSYIGFDGHLHVDPGEPFYSDMSLWDTYRTLHPLLGLAWPEAQQDFASSLVRMAEQGGYLPRWPLNRGYGQAMVGDPADIVLAETWLKGLEDWDVSGGLRAAMRGADGGDYESDYEGRNGIRSYLEHGFVTTTATDGSVAITMEYGWADHALARWTESWGLHQDAERYAQRAQNPANLWDPETGFFRGRDSSGAFEPADDFSATAWHSSYVEGNAWQYLWAMPYDVPALAELQGGEDELLDRLDSFFVESALEEDTAWPDLYYWHGNEPDLHAPWVWALMDRPELGAPWIRWIRQTRYGTGPDGLDGNDDGGTLSAWYTLSALGLYPLAGTTTWALGPPAFDRAEVDLQDGSTLVIEARGDAPVSTASWDGVELNGSPVGGTVEHDDLLGGSELRFLLGPTEAPLESEREVLD
jgi:predicted alpha-1,2-mannosidase